MQTTSQLPLWVKTAQDYPLRFAQVREDPLLDSWVIDQVAKPNINVIMVGSGGCTASYLATNKKISELTLVDPNPAQLVLCQVKLQLLTNYTNEDRLAILGHANMPTSIRRNHIETLLCNIGCDRNQFGNIDDVAQLGLDYAGRYEILFAQLQQVLQPLRNSIDYDVKLTLLQYAFQQVMSNSNLIALFGKSATQNPALPFWKHFFQQTCAILNTSIEDDNPYLNQFLFGKFKHKVYPWLSTNKAMVQPTIKLQNCTIEDALRSSDQTYDFIHLSNVLDWLNESEATNLLVAACEKLNHKGFMLIRQLNSCLNIQRLTNLVTWLETSSKALLQRDRSFFYKRIHLGQKM